MLGLTAGDGSFQWTAMASPVRLRLQGLSDEVALAIARAVRADFAQTEQALSRFRETAELARLNAGLDRWTEVSGRLYAALGAALRAGRRTAGLFDPRVLGSLEQYGYRGAPHAAPASCGPAVEAWLERRPRRRSVRLHVAADLGGIGKGLGVRWGARIVGHLNVPFLLNAGGDLLAYGSGPDGRGWQIGVEDPTDPRRRIAALQLPLGGAVCTSSLARHHWRHDGQEVHHLIDPRTGRPGGAGLLAVTVVGKDPAWTEVWSKVLFLHGATGIEHAAGQRAALWVTDDGELGMTARARQFVFWRDRPRHVSRTGA